VSMRVSLTVHSNSKSFSDMCKHYGENLSAEGSLLRQSGRKLRIVRPELGQRTPDRWRRGPRAPTNCPHFAAPLPSGQRLTVAVLVVKGLCSSRSGSPLTIASCCNVLAGGTLLLTTLDGVLGDGGGASR